MLELRPVRPPVAVQIEYQKKLESFVKEMNNSLFWWLRAKYRQVDKDIIESTVQDGAMGDLVKELRRMEREWIKKANAFATPTAEWFSEKIQGYTAITLQTEMKKRDLARVGFDLKFAYHSVKERARFKAIVSENVSLIKSIAKENLTRVEGVVLRGVENGHDLATITKKLHEAFGVSERRAAMIARDQTNKATQALTSERLLSYGVTKAKWMHTSAGKTYRDSHVEMDGEIYDIEEGCYDPDHGDFIQPAELVNCHCCCIPIVDTSKELEEEPQEEPATEAAPPVEAAPTEEEPAKFTPADTISAANAFMEDAFGVTADYTGLDVEVANIANETFAATFEEFPEVKGGIDFVGEAHRRVALIKDGFTEWLADWLNAKGYPEGSSQFKRAFDFNMRRFSSLNAIKTNTWGINISGGQSYYKGFDGVVFNRTVGKDAKIFNQALKNSVKNGLHPVGCDTIKSVVDHELGHQFDRLLGLSSNPDFIKFYRAWSPAVIEKEVSRYATTSINEFIAECWSEYRNNPRPRKLARGVGDLIERLYREKFGKVKP